MKKLKSLIDDLGWSVALTYLLDKILQSLGTWARLYDVLLYNGESRATPILPANRGSNIIVRHFDGTVALAAGIPAPPSHSRAKPGVICFAAYIDGELVGYHWLTYAPHDDEMVRCQYVCEPEGAAAWGIDLWVAPKHRGGLVYSRLWDATYKTLRDDGKRFTPSYVIAANLPARRAEERLGNRCIGRAVHLKVGPVWLMIASLAPYVHIAFGKRQTPVMHVPPPAVDAA